MNIIEQLAKANADKKASTDATAKPAIDLRGSGLTNKSLSKMQSEINRQEKAALGKSDSEVIKAEQKLHDEVEAKADIMAADFVKGLGITLDPSQEAALLGMLSNQFAVLIGPAGSGKTTITKEFIFRLLQIIQATDFACAAFTGRASQQMRRALPPELHGNVSTIHSLLEFAPVEEDYEAMDPVTGARFASTRRVFRPARDASHPLTQKVFIFDEASMIPVQLWNLFIDACPRDARIILIGDIHQLPPVMDKSVLGFAMNEWPVFELTKIHRQSGGNPIIDNAHRVLKGEGLMNAPNFHLIGSQGKPVASSGAAGMQVQAIQWLAQLAKMGKFDPIRDAFIVPQNVGMIGQKELNPHLMVLFNPPREENGIRINRRIDIHTGTDRAAMAVGDKVMVTSNINTVTPPITNGMIGIVEEINLNGKYDQKRSQVAGESEADIDFGSLDTENFNEVMDEIEEKEDAKKPDTRDQRQASHVMTVKFENGQSLSCSTSGDYRRIMHSYAITCHKSQGGEYPNVVILVHSSNHHMLSQEWLYTAITRARENVYIFGNARGLQLALKNQRIKGHTLQQKIAAYNIEAKTYKDIDPDKLPVLWPRTQIEMSEIEETEGAE